MLAQTSRRPKIIRNGIVLHKRRCLRKSRKMSWKTSSLRPNQRASLTG